jgi:hypothetical protein
MHELNKAKNKKALKWFKKGITVNIRKPNGLFCPVVEWSGFLMLKTSPDHFNYKNFYST